MKQRYNFTRTNPPLTVQQSKAIHVFATALAGTLASRWNLASQLGMQYGTKRDLYEALGYDLTEIITYSKYKGFYTRNEVAKAVIDRPCKAIWQGKLSLEESKDDKDTPFEKAWDDLEKKFKLKSMFSRVDRLTGIGSYGVLLLGFNDVSQPEDFARPVGKTTHRNGESFETNGKKLELRYLKPFGEDHAPIKAYDENTKSERYGLPTLYTITIMNMMTKASTTIDVHWSRIIHVVDDPLESDIESAPRLEVIYNRLMDFEKVIGGSAEMFWRGARPGYWGEVDPNFQMTETTKLDLKNQLDELEHNLRRWFINKGVKVNSMASQVEDPQPTVNVLFRMVAVAYGIPKRILEGSERGELSSGQDADEWDSYVQARRDDHAEPHVVRPFVDKMIELGVLPKPGTDDYTVKWSDLFAKSEDEMVTIGQKRAQALVAYGNSTIQDYFPIEAFMEFCMGLNSDQIDLVMEMIKAGISEEQKAAITPDEEQMIEEEQKTMDEEIPVVPKGKKSKIKVQGGSGSGNFGHEGRPGEVGGSGDKNDGVNYDKEDIKEIFATKINFIPESDIFDYETEQDNIDSLKEQGYEQISKTNPEITKDDYWVATKGNFDFVEKSEWDSINEDIYTSTRSGVGYDSKTGSYGPKQIPTGSSYKIKDGYLYRNSNHWGRVASCDWNLYNKDKSGLYQYGIGKIKLSNLERKSTSHIYVLKTTTLLKNKELLNKWVNAFKK